MEYMPLRELSYMPEVRPRELADELNRRRQCPASVQLRFDDQQYFYVLVPEIAKLGEAIHEAERMIGSVIAALPHRELQPGCLLCSSVRSWQPTKSRASAPLAEKSKNY